MPPSSSFSSAACSPGLIDLVNVTAQLSVDTQAIIDTIHGVPTEHETFSARVRKGRLVLCYPFWTNPSKRSLVQEVECQGRFTGVLEGLAQSLRDLQGADFYDRRISITWCGDEEAIYVGKFRIPVRQRSRREEVDPVEARKELLRSQIAEIDALHAAAPPLSRVDLALRYERDDGLVKLLKELRGPACQICGSTFPMANGGFYCEAHHLEHLAHAGLDVSSNIVLLCGNHHREFHYGHVELIDHTSDALTVRINGETVTCRLE